jgi:hypothetical protein
MTWRLPDTYHSAGHGRGTATLKFYEGRDILTIVAGTSFDPERIAERYWEVVHVDGPWQAEFRFTGE